jgi:hypothetical protein
MADIKATQVQLLYRIDIGFDPHRGYAATLLDLPNARQKGIRGNSPEQLMSRLRNVVLEEMHKRKNYPLESESQSSSPIITPGGGDPLFNGL